MRLCPPTFYRRPGPPPCSTMARRLAPTAPPRWPSLSAFRAVSRLSSSSTASSRPRASSRRTRWTSSSPSWRRSRLRASPWSRRPSRRDISVFGCSHVNVKNAIGTAKVRPCQLVPLEKLQRHAVRSRQRLRAAGRNRLAKPTIRDSRRLRWDAVSPVAAALACEQDRCINIAG